MKTSPISALVAAAAFALGANPAAAAIQTEPTSTGAVCSLGHLDAAAKNLAPADYPEFARIAGVTGSTTIQIDLDERGGVRRASVLASSGSAMLDKAALEAVRQSTFSPEQNDCVPTAGSYSVIVDFTA